MQRLGWQPSSSSSSSNPWLSPPKSDGPQSQPQLKLPLQLPSTKATSTDQRRPNAPDVGSALRQPGRVADRIRAINSLQQLPSNVPKKPIQPVAPLNPPIALHPEDDLRHASPFPRRDSAQSPIRPETPLSQSRPHRSPLVHCPMPKRYQPQLSANIEKKAMPVDTQPMCYRHGRKLKLRKSVPADMDRAFSGAYIPIGHHIRQQVDPLSPWAVGTRLAKTSGTTVSPDICPDCLAEQHIIERETEMHKQNSRTRADQPLRSASSSIFTERGTPPEPDQPSNVLVGTTIDSQTVKVPGATVCEMPPDKFGGIVATDLGDMIDAIIVEHSGSLGKVISNIRNGMPDSDWTQKLSRDLTKVSEAVASLPEDNIKHAPAFSRNINGRRSIILDASPDSLRQRAKTMPELLDLVDAATQEFSMTASNSREQKFNLDRPFMPGEFPKSPSTLSSAIVNPAVALPAMPPLSSAQSNLSVPLSTSPQAARSTITSEQLVVNNQSPRAAPIKASATITDPRPFEADEDEATLVETEVSLPSMNLPSKANEGQSNPDAASTTQQRSRIPKATTIPLVRPLYALSDALRFNQARPKPSTIAKQHQQQRIFQQGWLREAAVAERAGRRSRSRSRGATHV
ncbi:unnamed protein product [Aureobasidium mustum]|uniref:Uncharacterized protein n=1 Tax=Aureobasidium mustum TaxID=2773714 RepID=A0A9N8PDL3_9PEZI|nr:unnamed protein product [Aureobasidium mustum]